MISKGAVNMDKQLERLNADNEITLSIREFGRTRTFALEKQKKWILGRETLDNKPDIPIKSQIAGRVHGEFSFVDGFLFYIDKGSANGTFYNGEKIACGLNGRANPVLLQDGDILQISCITPDISEPESVQMKIDVVNKI